MKWNNTWMFPIAILIIGIPMWVVPYTQLKSIHTYLLILVAVVAFVLSAFTRIAPWKVALTTALSLLLALMIRFLLDRISSVDDHRLWSLVLFFAVFAALVLSFGGAYLGYVVRRWFRTHR